MAAQVTSCLVINGKIIFPRSWTISSPLGLEFSPGPVKCGWESFLMAKSLKEVSPPALSHSSAHCGLTGPWDPPLGMGKDRNLIRAESEGEDARLWTCITVAKGEVIKSDGFGPAKEK